MQDNADEIVLLNKAITCLEEEVQVKDEIIKQQELIIKSLQEHNNELTSLMNKIFKSLEKG